MTQTVSDPTLSPVLERIDNDFDASVERLRRFLSIPSISTDPQFKPQTREAAQWIAKELREIGLDAMVRDTPGHPMVVAKSSAKPGAPRVMFYGHYDVQPPDPLDLWESPPFEPAILEGEHGKRIVARGAVDDKGQLMTFVEAFRAWMHVHGDLPINITVLLEGEEESGSVSLDSFLQTHCDELQADVCVVCDTGMWDIATPAITTMLRGLLYVELTLHGPARDLHSGMYGGAVLNPINALVRTLAQLHDDDGVVQVPGFYDEVRELSAEQRTHWESLGFNEREFLGEIGLPEGRGEKGRTTLERVWSRPTCDINGIWGGYTGKGAKTVIASHAAAKVSFRLVPDQDPGRIMNGLKQFLDARTPAGGRWQIESHGGSPAIEVPTGSPYLDAARIALAEVYGKAPVLIGCGGSIPVVGSIRKILGFDSLLVGFGLDDDRVHSPNEKFELTCYRNGQKSHAAMLAQFAAMKKG